MNGAISDTMSLLANVSYLELFWIIQAILVVLSWIVVSMSGNFDKTRDLPAADEQNIGWFGFRKRVKQYYMVGLLWTVWLTWSWVAVMCYDSPLGERLHNILGTVTSPQRHTSDSSSTLLACVFMLIHILHRLYQSAFTSIYSQKQVLNPIDIILAFAFQLGVGLSLIAEGPIINGNQECITWSTLYTRWNYILAAAIFLFASTVHNRSHVVLAKLRRNRFGHITTTGYKLPKGGWFEMVSCPHYFAEVLIFVSIGLILGFSNCTWWSLTIYMALQQGYTAYNVHSWYKLKFDDYPSTRKMYIPFLL